MEKRRPKGPNLGIRSEESQENAMLEAGARPPAGPLPPQAARRAPDDRLRLKIVDTRVRFKVKSWATLDVDIMRRLFVAFYSN